MLTSTGKVFTGCNIETIGGGAEGGENGGYSSCSAERYVAGFVQFFFFSNLIASLPTPSTHSTALLKALSESDASDFSAIAISCDAGPQSAAGSRLAGGTELPAPLPTGADREFMASFGDFDVILVRSDGSFIRTTTFKLLPSPTLGANGNISVGSGVQNPPAEHSSGWDFVGGARAASSSAAGAAATTHAPLHPLSSAVASSLRALRDSVSGAHLQRMIDGRRASSLKRGDGTDSSSARDWTVEGVLLWLRAEDGGGLGEVSVPCFCSLCPALRCITHGPKCQQWHQSRSNTYTQNVHPEFTRARALPRTVSRPLARSA